MNYYKNNNLYSVLNVILDITNSIKTVKRFINFELKNIKPLYRNFSAFLGITNENNIC